MEDVEHLVAIEEIKRLKARYFRAIDSKDWDAYAHVFTEQAVMDMTEEVETHAGQPLDAEQTVYVGRHAIADYVSSKIDPAVTVHQGHTPDIDVLDADQAQGTWQLAGWLDFGDREPRGWGHYHEEYERENGQWLIARCELTRIRNDWTLLVGADTGAGQ